ncbi:MAG: ParA family protein [Chloroflexota bacterium]
MLNGVAAATQAETTLRPGATGTEITAVVQEKGGVGKTTTVINLGAWYAKLGHRTLLIDLDPQGNLAKGLGIASPGGAMYRVFRDPSFPLDSAIVPSTVPNLDLAPADNGLEAAEVELIHSLSRESVLRRKLAAADLHGRYDRILLDCRPSLGVLTVNAMVASGRLLIPVETQYFAIEALEVLLDVVKTVRETLQPELRIAGIVPTKHEPRVRVCQVTLALLQERYPQLLTQTVIRKYVAFAEAQLRGQPIYSVAPGTDAAEAYHALALELEGAPDGNGTASTVGGTDRAAHRRTKGGRSAGGGRVSEATLPLQQSR